MATAEASVETKTHRRFTKDLGNGLTILLTTGCGTLGVFIAIIGSYKKQNPAVNQDPKHLTDTTLTVEGLQSMLRTDDLRPMDSPLGQELRAVASDDKCITDRFPKGIESLIVQGSGLLPRAAAAVFEQWAMSQGQNLQLGFVATSNKTWIPEAAHLGEDT